MRKKCIAIAKKAMVWTLAASMLVATPLTASAAGLRGVYKVEDHSGNIVDESGGDNTGTVTTTESDTGSRVLNNDSKLVGIVLNETDVKLELPGKESETLDVEFVWDGTMSDADKAEAEKDLKKFLTWRSSDNKVVALENLNKGSADRMALNAKAGGSATVTVSLDDDANNLHYSTTANVFVKEYATALGFLDELQEDAYEGVSLDLNEYLDVTPKSANDDVTFEIVSVENKCATLKNGILKLNKNKAGSKVTIIAIGEKEMSEPKEITVNKANPATKVEILDETGAPISKADWLVNDKGHERTFKVRLTTKESGKCTDQITWSSKKPAIVEVQGNGEEATLVAKSVGTAQITAQASGGKKGTVNVTVRANLTGFSISAGTDELYAGQTLKLSSTQRFDQNGKENFTDAGLTWSFKGDKDAVKKMKKIASINAKTGVLTIKPDITAAGNGEDDRRLVITATNSKNVGKASDTTYKKKGNITADEEIRIDLKQISITKITVYKNMSENSGILAAASVSDGKVTVNKPVNTVEIAADKSRTYKVVAEGVDESGQTVENPTYALNWASSSEKLAIATRNSDGSGTVEGVNKGKPTITISGATKKGNKYVAVKTTFKANVTVPTKFISLTTKNSAISGTGKAQTIAVKAALQKGTTNKAGEIQWSAVKISNGVEIPLTTNDIKGGKLKLAKNSYEAGDQFRVTASLPSAGVQSRIILDVVQPSSKIQFVDSAGTKITKLELSTSSEATTLSSQIQVNGSWHNSGSETPENLAKVTYTVNKKGVIQLNKDDEVIPIKKGTAKITATTADGKKATLTVKVN